VSGYLRLKDLGRWLSGGTPPRDEEALWEGSVPWVSAKDFAANRLRDPSTFITDEAAEHHSKCVPAGSILLIVRGMALAHGLQIAQAEGTVAFNQDLRALVCVPELHSRFVYYSLLGHRPRLNRHIDQAAHGTARLTGSVYGERIWSPDLPTQVRVANFLDRETDRIAMLGQACQDLAGDLIQPALAVFAEAASAWPAGKVGHRYSVQLGKMLDEKRIEVGNECRYLRNTNVQWDRFDLEDLKAMKFSPLERSRYELRRGDLLVCEGGQPGRSAVWRGGLEGCYFQKALMRVRPRAGDSTRYLMWCLRLASERGDFAAGGTGSTILHLPAERLIATRIPLPPPTEQIEITRRADAWAARAAAVETEVVELQENLAEYRDALITEAVTGRLDVAGLPDSQLEESARAAREGKTPEALVT
jgi:type I restriction enzyme S subunit